MTEDSRDAAWTLLSEWTESDSLRRHALAVEAAMRACAERAGRSAAEVELWGLTGLLHDLDYERFPDMDAADGHPRTALRELAERGYPEAMLDAIAGHAPYLGVPRETELARALFAVDELSGFLLACAYVRPEGLSGMTPRSVRKKMKSAGFAAAISREDLTAGADELGVPFDEHVTLVIAALAGRADVLLPTPEASA